MSDMIETNAREFSRKFAMFRRKAAHGVTVRVTAPDGVFLLTREARGITSERFLRRLESGHAAAGVFDVGGAERVAEGRAGAQPARSPWA
jgi:hypothetical protein